MTRRVLHIINSLTHGGAEAMLCNLVCRHDRSRWEPVVATLIDDTLIAGPLRAAGIPIHSARMRAGRPDPRGLMRLARLIRAIEPDLVQTWMDHSNLIGGLAARLAGRAPVIWGLHHSEHIRGVAKRSTRLTVACCAKLSSRLPAKIISCSHHGQSRYGAIGFDKSRLCVIPNGFDADRFRPDEAARKSLRAELGLDGDALLIGLAARFDPFKDHATFIASATQVAAALPAAHFVLCGTNIDAGNAALAAMIREHGVGDRCHLLGPCFDMPRIFAALDLVVSSSIGEAFPLVLGEAMNCGVLCVATDVGDSAYIIGEHGRIVPPRDPAAMARACIEVLSMPRAARVAAGVRARESIVDRFSLGAVTQEYERLYEKVALSANRGEAMSTSAAEASS